MATMPSFDGPVQGDASGGLEVPAHLAAFTPMTFIDSLGWVPITGPQAGPRAACLSITAHIHLLNPDLPLRDLDERAQDSIAALESGARSVTVIDEFHRVDRADAGPRRQRRE
jgi:hypothetical protein